MRFPIGQLVILCHHFDLVRGTKAYGVNIQEDWTSILHATVNL